MPRSQRPTCARCGVGVSGAFDALMSCARCRAMPPAFEAASAPWQYTGAVREAVHLWKYRHHWKIGPWLAGTMAAWGTRTLPLDEIDVVIPVPLHRVKRHLKGFQPVEELAETVATALHKPCERSFLHRWRFTSTQTRLSWTARWRNVRRAFIASRPDLQGLNVLLIDDVLTSGATANACTLALKDAGAHRVFVLTAARTPRA